MSFHSIWTQDRTVGMESRLDAEPQYGIDNGTPSESWGRKVTNLKLLRAKAVGPPNPGRNRGRSAAVNVLRY